LEPRLPVHRLWDRSSIDGQIRAAEANIARVTGKTIVIPGHGAVGGKADLILFRDVLVEIRDKVAALKKQGKSLSTLSRLGPGHDMTGYGATCSRTRATLLRSCTRAFENIEKLRLQLLRNASRSALIFSAA